MAKKPDLDTTVYEEKRKQAYQRAGRDPYGREPGDLESIRSLAKEREARLNIAKARGAHVVDQSRVTIPRPPAPKGGAIEAEEKHRKELEEALKQ